MSQPASVLDLRVAERQHRLPLRLATRTQPVRHGPEKEIHAELRDRLVAMLTDLFQPVATAVSLAKLTPRERQVLDLVVASKPNKIIADILGISIKTVELHRANMMGKLGVRSVPDLMKVALGHG